MSSKDTIRDSHKFTLIQVKINYGVYYLGLEKIKYYRDTQLHGDQIREGFSEEVMFE